MEDMPHVSYGSVEVLPSRRRPRRCHAPGRCCLPSDVATLCRSLVFLLVQGVVAWVVGLALLAALALSLVLTPLCGLGIVLFRLLFRLGVVDFVAKCDAAMVNYVAREQIQIDASSAVLPLMARELDDGDCDGLPTERLVSGLSRVSVESAMVLVYLTTVKLLLASLGLAVASLVLALPLLLVHVLLSQRPIFAGASTGGWETLCSVAVLVLVFLVALMSLDLLTGLCAAATRFFCCERVYALPLPRPGTASSSSFARPNVVVIRLPPSASGVYALASSSLSSSSASSSSTVAVSSS